MDTVMENDNPSNEELLLRIAELETRLAESEDTLRAIQNGEVDAICVRSGDKDQIFTLKGADRTYRTLMEDMNQGAITTTADGTILYANRAFGKMTGAKPETIAGSRLERFVDPAEIPMMKALLHESMTKDVEGEVSLSSEKGLTVPAFFSLTRIEFEGDLVLCITATDLTEKRIQDDVVRSERLSRAVIDTAGEAILVCDSKGRIIRANHAAESLGRDRILLRPIGEVLCLEFADDEEEVDGQKFSVERVLEGGDYHRRAVRINGAESGNEERFFLLSATTIRAEKEVVGCVVVMTDVTRLKHVEMALRNEKKYLATTLLSIGDGVISTDKTGRVQLMNGVAEKLTGWGIDEARGIPLERVFHIINEYSRERCENPVTKVIDSGKIVGLANNTVLIAKDGKERIIADSGSPIVDDEGKIVGVILVFRDITEKTRLEGEIRQQQKLEALGTLAGGIAHDFNNLLFVIVGNTEIARERMPSGHESIRRLEEILKACFRAQEMIKRILSFGRKPVTKKTVIRCAPIIKETIELVRSTTPTSIEVVEKLDCSRDAALASPTEIHQVLINLCTNAAQALRDESGRIEICIDNVKIEDESERRLEKMRTGWYLRLTVSDDGCGMTPDVIERIFDPFYTTREAGGGTGLGLSVTHGIINGLGGSINVESELNKGTTFSVYLPVVDERPEEDEVEMTNVRRGKGIILVVDDDEAIVDIQCAMLESMGYSVEGFTESREALERIRSEPGKFDLIISDQTMPKMTGDKLADEISNVRSDLPVVLCTGYSNQLTEERIEKLGIKEVLMKPISKYTLAECVAGILGKTRDKKE